MMLALLWGLTAAGTVLAAGLLFRVGAKMVGAEGATLGRAMLCALFSTIVVAAVAAIVFILTAEVMPGREDLTPWMRWLGSALVVVVSVAILRNGLGVSFGKAIGIWCAAVGLAALLAVVLMPAWAWLAACMDRLVPPAG